MTNESNDRRQHWQPRPRPEWLRRVNEEGAHLELLDVFENCATDRAADDLQIPLLLVGQGKRFAMNCTNIETFETVHLF